MADNVLRFDFLARDQASSTFEKIGKESDGLQTKVSRFGGLASKALKLTGVAMGGLAVAGVTMGVKTAAAMEQAQVGFTTLLGSGQKAQTFLTNLKTFAAATPFDLPGLVDSSRTLLGVGLSASMTMKTLQAYGNAASAVGISQDAFRRVMLATSQSISAGRFNAGDLNQVTEAGIPIWKILAESMHKTVPEVKDMSSKGQLLAGTVLPLLNKEMNKDYSGSMAKQSQTLNGLWSTFTDTLNIGLSNAIQPMIPALKNGLAGATKIATVAFKDLPKAVDAVSSKLGGLKDLVNSKVKPVLDNMFSGISLGNIGKTIQREAGTWSGFIINGIRVGFTSGDWGPLGKTIMNGLSQGFKKASSGSIGMAQTMLAGLQNVSFLKTGVVWAQSILDGVTVGLNAQDWGPLGATLGTGLSLALVASLKGATKFGTAVVKWIGGIDWFNLGEAVGKQAAPFIVGFATTMVTGLINVAKEHPLDTALFILSLIPIGKFASAFGPLRDLIEHLPLGEWFTSMLDHSAAPAYDAISNFVTRFFGRMGDAFTSQFPEVSGAVSGMFKSLGGMISSAAETAGLKGLELTDGLAESIGKGAADVIKASGRLIKDLVTPYADAGKWLVVRGADLVDGLMGGIADRFTPLASRMTETIGKVRTPFSKASTWLTSKGGDVIDGLRGGISGQWHALGDTAENTISRIVTPFGKARKWLYQAGRSLLAGLFDGMVNGAEDAGHFAASVGGKIVSAVKGYFGIHSPSTVMMGIGGNLISSVFKAMVDHNPVPVMGKIFGGMPEALGALADKGLVSIKNLPSKALNALEGLGGSLGGKIAGMLGLGSGGGGGANLKGGLSAAERWIIMHESGGRTNAQNPTSTAFGLGQLLIANRVHYGKILGVSANTTNYADQLAMFRMYVHDRYGTAQNAQKFWESHHWYGSGGLATGAQMIGVGEKGPERVLNAGQTRSFENLVRVLDRSQSSGYGSAPQGADIDYRKLGDHVAAAFTRAGINVSMDGKAVGKVLGKTSSVLGRTG